MPSAQDSSLIYTDTWYIIVLLPFYGNLIQGHLHLSSNKINSYYIL